MTEANARYLLDEKLGKLILWQWKELGYTESSRRPCLHLLSDVKCPVDINDIKSGVGTCLPVCEDHTSVWNKDGKVAAIVTQPYEIDEYDLEDIHALCKTLDITVTVSNRWNWYYKEVISLVFMKKEAR